MTKLTVGGVTLNNPVLNAAGTMGFGPSYSDYIDLNQLGGLVTRTMTYKPGRGAPNPRLWETPSGLMNRVGVQNPGYEKFVNVFYKGLEKFDVSVIASITGTPEQIRDMTNALSGLDRVKAIEVNLFCDYEDYRDLGRDGYLARCEQMVRAAEGKLPVWAKLMPMTADLVETANRLQKAGVSAVVCANTYWAMAFDEKGVSRLGSPYGGLSGPAIKPLSVFQTWRIAHETTIDVVGCGGIRTAEDAKEYLTAGAKAVEIGTANFTEPETVVRITKSL